MKKELVLAVGNLYLETNFIGVKIAGKEILEVGKEYAGTHYESHLGGSAVNFSTQIKKLGMDVGVIGKIGHDQEGESLVNLLKEAGIVTDFVRSSRMTQTNIDVGIVFEKTANNIQVVAGSANQSLSLDDIDLESSLFDNVQAVYFGGSLKQKNLWPHYPNLLGRLKNKGIKLFLDHGRVPVDAASDWVSSVSKCLPFVDGYFPNEEEILSVSGKTDLDEAIEEMFRFNPRFIAVKRGGNGAIIRVKEDKLVVPGHRVTAVNTVGAGDAFNAGFICQYLMGKKLERCGKFANALAAIRVSKNKQPDLAEVEEFLKAE